MKKFITHSSEWFIHSVYSLAVVSLLIHPVLWLLAGPVAGTMANNLLIMIFQVIMIIPACVLFARYGKKRKFLKH
jgi:hypothetical protein